MGAVLPATCCSGCLPSARSLQERRDGVGVRALHRSGGGDPLEKRDGVGVRALPPSGGGDPTECIQLHSVHDGQTVMVDCPDCREMIPARNFHDHRVNKCQHRMIACPDCQKLMLIKHLDDHQAHECDHHCRKQLSVEMEQYLAKFVDCPDCRKRVLATDFNEHRSNECDHRLVTCPECLHVVLSLHLDEHKRNQCDHHLRKLLSTGEAHRLATLVDCMYCRKRVAGTEINNHMVMQCPHRKIDCVECGWKVYAKHMDEHKRTECNHHNRGNPSSRRKGLHSRSQQGQIGKGPQERRSNGNEFSLTEQMMNRAAALDENTVGTLGALEQTVVARNLSPSEAQKLVDRLGGGGARERRPRAIYLGGVGAVGTLTRGRARSPSGTSPLRATSPSGVFSPLPSTRSAAQGTNNASRARSPASPTSKLRSFASSPKPPLSRRVLPSASFTR